MSRVLLFLSLLLACATTHGTNGGPSAAQVEISIFPLRSLSLDEAQAEIWRPELRPAWRAPTEEEHAALAELIPAIHQGASTGRLDAQVGARAAAIGMRVERWEVGGRIHLVLLEAADQRRGAGAYFFAVAPAANPWYLLEAPHAYYDLRTGVIGADLYFAPPPGQAPAAFFTNTLHRHTQADGKRARRSTNPSDACHNPDHLLNVATLAAADAAPGATVIQLHGFAADTEDDDGKRPPATALAVISAGADAPTPLSAAAAATLRPILGDGVLLYPSQVQALGATTNVQKRGLAGIPGARFLHVEMAGALRDRLVQDPSLREAFASALYTLASRPDATP